MTALLLAALAAAPGSFKLKPGAEGAQCLVCHNQFKEQLARPHVHTPVRSKQCTGCHSPHAARHGKLLAVDKAQVCLTCHSTVVPREAKSTHAPVARGACVSCHDPHASANPAVLVKPAAELCASCHQPIAEGAAKATVKHAPLEKEGCAACHLPHGSAKATHLLKAEVPALCVSCHDPRQKKFGKAHLGYPVSRSQCTSCHDPHGSSQKGMLYDSVHKPVASRSCSQCHELPGSARPLATRRQGLELCRSCHAEKVALMLDKGGVHRPLLDEASCLSCHAPHASRQPALLARPQLATCGSCHADTIARQERSPTRHPPVAQGQCTSCHDPHASDGTLLLGEKHKPESCAPCHENMQHSSHPLGAKFKDPRNPNRTLDCLSCHRAHGTEHKHLIPAARTTELCVQCHERFKR